MENNLPQKYDKGIFYKIKNFFLRLFGKKSDTISEDVVNSEMVKPKEVKNKNSIEVMREENRKEREKEKLLNQLEENPSLIDNWTSEKLLKLEKIYDEKISKYNKEITILKAKIA